MFHFVLGMVSVFTLASLAIHRFVILFFQLHSADWYFSNRLQLYLMVIYNNMKRNSNIDLGFEVSRNLNKEKTLNVMVFNLGGGQCTKIWVIILDQSSKYAE